MSFLAKCKCEGTDCQCSDFFSNQPIFVSESLNAKANTMNDQLTKIANLLASLDPQQRTRVIADLPADTRKTLLQELTNAKPHGKKRNHGCRCQSSEANDD
jgi:hypothetical protein